MKRNGILTLALASALAAAACTHRTPIPTGGTADCAAQLAAGDLVITEVMANPSGTDSGKEWFEVHNSLPSALDLTGLEIVSEKDDSTGPMTHIVDKQTIGPDAYLVFGGAAPLPKPDYVDYDYGHDLGSLRNEDGQLVL